MAYRKPTPPVKSEREQQLEALTKRGAAVLQRQEEQQRRAELAAKHAEQRHELSREAGRNRQIGRLNRPWLGGVVVTGVVVPITAAGVYGFLHSGMFVAVWVHLLLWGVMLPSVALGIFAERFLSARLGVADRQAIRAWTDSLPFQVIGYESDLRSTYASFVLRFRFESAAPEGKQLVQVLAGIDEGIAVKLAEYPGPPMRDSGDDISLLELSLPALSIFVSESDGVAHASDDGSFAVTISHRGGHECRAWLLGWATTAMREAVEPLHKLYALPR